MSRVNLTLVFLLGGLSQSACVSIWHFNDLEARVNGLEQDKNQLTEEQQKDKERLKTLHADMKEATDVLKRSGADLVADLDEVKGKVSRLEGVDEETAFALARLDKDIAAIKKVLDEKLGIALIDMPAGMPEDKAGMLASGKKYYEKGDMTTARGILRKIVDQWPDSTEAPQAQLLIAETFMAQKLPEKAIAEFQLVYERYREVSGAPVPRALLRISEILTVMKDCKKAIDVYGILIDTAPKSGEAKLAKGRVEKMKKTCK